MFEHFTTDIAAISIMIIIMMTVYSMFLRKLGKYIIVYHYKE